MALNKERIIKYAKLNPEVTYYDLAKLFRTSYQSIYFILNPDKYENMKLANKLNKLKKEEKKTPEISQKTLDTTEKSYNITQKSDKIDCKNCENMRNKIQELESQIKLLKEILKEK